MTNKEWHQSAKNRSVVVTERDYENSGYNAGKEGIEPHGLGLLSKEAEDAWLRGYDRAVREKEVVA